MPKRSSKPGARCCSATHQWSYADQDMKVISVEAVSKKFILAHDRPGNLADAARGLFGRRQREDFWALKDVSFDVEQGEALGVIGHNGAGKSTMLKLLTRIMNPTSGRIRTRGRVSALIEVGAGFHPEMTGRENIYLNGSILGMTQREISAKFDEIVAFAELEKFIDTPVKRYSSGMYARLGFAVAAHVDPEILIVDEVLAVGDLAFQQKCYLHMERLLRNGCCVVLVTHSMLVAKRVCARLVWIEKGHLRRIGDSESVAAQYQDVMNARGAGDAVGVGNRWGSGAVQITAVSAIVNPSALGSGYDIEVVLDVETQHRVESPVIWAMISTSTGHKILGSTNQRQPGGSEYLDGCHRATCRFSNAPLMPGAYSVQAGVFDRALVPLDRWGDAASFAIDSNPDTRGLINQEYDGSVASESVWTFLKADGIAAPDSSASRM